MMWYWGGGVHWWGWLLGALAMVAFWGVLIWAVWYFVTAVTRRSEGSRPQDQRLEGDRPGTADPKRILSASSTSAWRAATSTPRSTAGYATSCRKATARRRGNSARSAPRTAVADAERHAGPGRHMTCGSSLPIRRAIPLLCPGRPG